MSDLKKLVAQFMSELEKFEATTTQEPITADEFSPEELADLSKFRQMAKKVRAKIAANTTANTKNPKLDTVSIPQPEETLPMTEAANDKAQTKAEDNNFGMKVLKLDIEGCMPRVVIFETANGKELGKITIKPGDEEPFRWTIKLDPKELFTAGPITVENAGKLKIIARIQGVTKEQEIIRQRQVISFEHLVSTTFYQTFTVETRWFGDGEKEFAILANGLAFGSGGTPDYWDIKILEKIKDETGADLSAARTNSAQFINGNRASDVQTRTKQGAEQARSEAFGIFDKLKRDPKTGKIVQRIQLYTHSKGAAFGDGYIDELKIQARKYHETHDNIFADIDHLIDIVIDLDAHQSWGIHKENDNYPNIALAHGNGIADANQTGDLMGFDRSPSMVRGFIVEHGNDTFLEELDMVLDQHNKNEFSENPDKYEGFEHLFDEDDKKYGITTEVNKPNSRKQRTTHTNPDKHHGMGGHAGRTPNYPIKKKE